jgi:hypothetical protein
MAFGQKLRPSEKGLFQPRDPIRITVEEVMKWIVVHS